MPQVFRYAIMTGLAILICLASIFPVEENLRLGKDLAGGVSLVYTVDVKPDDPPDVVDRTISVLKDRVNPKGLFEISFQQQGRDRIEITMPLPNEKVRVLRGQYDAALSKLNDYSLDTDAFQRAMRLTGAERDAALDALMTSQPRRDLLTPVKEAITRAEQTRAAYQAASSASPPPPDLDALLEAAADADVALEKARDTVLASHVTPDELRAALELPSRAHKVEDPKTKEFVEIPSARDQAVAGIRSRIEKLTDSSKVIDEILAAYEAYAKDRRGLDDPSDLVRLLRGAGVLDFRIAIAPGQRADETHLRQELRERGPDNVQVEGADWYRINSIDNWYDNTEQLRALRDTPAEYFAGRNGLVVEARDGLYYVLLHDAPGMRLTKAEGEWSVSRAYPTVDDLGRPAIGFNMDPRGATLLGDLTEKNVNRPMAVVLDDQVITAPNLNSRISNSGIIQGNFPQEEINYIVKVLGAGSLQAKLGSQPISQSVLAPELGTDNLLKGLDAAWISFILIGVFMCCYYFFNGVIAMVVLVINAIIILGIMSLNRAAFTLPGIAGIVLTFGTAVDANILIYERIREEIRGGNDMRTAVRVAFKRVGTTIIDANLTNLIICLVLVYTGTQEIRGFGITLGIGVVSTLFCTIVVTRLFYMIFIDQLKAGFWAVNQLPLAIPAIQKLMTPRVNWMRLFPLFAVISIVFCSLGIGMCFYEGSKLLDSEFRGGTSIMLQFKDQEQPGASARSTMTLTRAEVQDRIQRVATASEATAEKSLVELRNAEIVPIDPQSDGVTSDRFAVRTTILDDQALRAAIVDAFGDVVESRPAIQFQGSSSETLTGAPVHGIVDARLGSNFGRPEIMNDVSAYIGGVVILMEDLDARPSRASLTSRLEYMRSDPTYSSDALKREHVIIVLEGSDEAVQSAALVVRDSRLSLFDDEAKWRTDLAAQEWEITREALTVPTVLASVNSFAPAIAQTFRAQAISAVVISLILISIYVWVRFGSVRFSLAAVVPLVHDALASIGMVALAEIIYTNIPGAAQFGFRPIKIDLGMVAAIMTIIGYSLNDTIVVLDRIRENRGKLAYISKDVINNSINQTMSRTYITAGTALVSLLVLYFVGGEGISSFAYTMIWGMIFGTYSSIAIAAPIVYSRHVPPAPTTYTPDSDLASDDDRLLPSSAGT